jgi:hypothetical protein
VCGFGGAFIIFNPLAATVDLHTLVDDDMMYPKHPHTD